MKSRTWIVLLGVVAIGFAASGRAFSQYGDRDKGAKEKHSHDGHDHDHDHPHDHGDHAHGQPDEQAMMKMMQAMSAPGKEHEALNPLVGTWSCDLKFWMAPGAPPDVSSGTMTRKWTMGNRYLVEDAAGTAMGMPFQGHGINGYDKAQGHYWGIWIDTMGTGVHYQTGSADASGKVFTYEGENFDPSIGRKRWGKSVVKIINDDKHMFQMFVKGPDGKEFQNFEMTCTRK